MVGTIKVGKLQAADGTRDTISIESGHKISGAAGSLAIPGQVIQFVNGRVSDDRDATTSTSYVQLGDTLSITPKFSTSKIFILAVVNPSISGGGGNTIYFDFGRTTGGTTTKPISGVSNGISTMGFDGWNTITYSFLDSPNTTSQVTYFSVAKVSAGTVYYNDNSTQNLTNFTLMEIAQ